jgi:hypothetical protein
MKSHSYKMSTPEQQNENNKTRVLIYFAAETPYPGSAYDSRMGTIASYDYDEPRVLVNGILRRADVSNPS